MMTLSKQKNYTFTSLLEDIRGSKCCIIKVRQYIMPTIPLKHKCLSIILIWVIVFHISCSGLKKKSKQIFFFLIGTNRQVNW